MIINLDYHCDMALYTFLVFFEFHRPTNMRQPVNEVKCIKNQWTSVAHITSVDREGWGCQEKYHGLLRNA